MPRRMIGSVRVDFLAGRLSSLLSSWRVAQKTDAALVLCWPKRNPHLPKADYSLKRIFDIDRLILSDLAHPILLIEDVTETQFRQAFGGSDGRAMLKRFRRKLTPDLLFEEDASVCLYQIPLVVFQGEDRETVRQEILALFNRLPIASPIAHSLDAIRAKVDLSQTVAVHIRRGDIVSEVLADDFDTDTRHGVKWMSHFTSRYVPLPSYYRQLAAMGNPEVIVYSDTAGDAEAFVHGYPGRARLAASLLPETRKPSFLMDSFLEFMMIGASAMVIGAEGSHFSSYPAWLFGRKFIDVLGKMSADEVIADVTALFALDAEPSPHRHRAGLAFFTHYRQTRFIDAETPDAIALERAIARLSPGAETFDDALLRR